MQKVTLHPEKSMTNKTIGQDIIYICQECSNREKEFALTDRNYKYCSKCGSFSIKSNLVDSYTFVTNLRFNPPQFKEILEDLDDEEYSY